MSSWRHAITPDVCQREKLYFKTGDLDLLKLVVTSYFLVKEEISDKIKTYTIEFFKNHQVDFTVTDVNFNVILS